MANGHGGPRPGSGRPKGSKDKYAGTDLLERLKKSGADPAEFLSGVLADTEESKTARFAAAKALLPYCYPRLSTQEIAVSGNTLPDVTLNLVLPDDDAESPGGGEDS